MKKVHQKNIKEYQKIQVVNLELIVVQAKILQIMEFIQEEGLKL